MIFYKMVNRIYSVSNCFIPSRKYKKLATNSLARPIDKQYEDDCMSCLIMDLKQQNWKDSPDEIFLKIAYEKKIINNITTSIEKLSKEDKESLESVLIFLALDEYHLL